MKSSSRFMFRVLFHEQTRSRGVYCVDEESNGAWDTILPFGKVRVLEPKPFVGAKNAKDLENFL